MDNLTVLFPKYPDDIHPKLERTNSISKNYIANTIQNISTTALSLEVNFFPGDTVRRLALITSSKKFSIY